MLMASEGLSELKTAVSHYGLNSQLVGVIGSTHFGIGIAILNRAPHNDRAANPLV
ncbi:hypothetical protein D3C84_1288990 [compost metagenome]